MILTFIKMNVLPEKRKEIVYYEGTTLQTLRYGQWKAHFIIQNQGWFGPKEKLGAPLLFNLRRDPYESVPGMIFC